MIVQPIVFRPRARDAIRRFPKEARLRLGRGLYRLQMGEQLGMPSSHPMPGVAAGVSELRVRRKTAVSARSITWLQRGVFWSFTLLSRRPGERLPLKSNWRESG